MRDGLGAWIALSFLLLVGAGWATWRVGPALVLWQGAVLWLPLLLVIGLGSWFRARTVTPSELSLTQKISGTWLLLLIFGGIDAAIVFGEAAWRPITFGAGVCFLLFGWSIDWSQIASFPRWLRSFRKGGYFGLVLLGLAVVPFVEPYLALLFFSFAELLSPQLYEAQRSRGGEGNCSIPIPPSQ